MAASAKACNLSCAPTQGMSLQLLQLLAGCQNVSTRLLGLIPDGGGVTCKFCFEFIPEKIETATLNIVLPLS